MATATAGTLAAISGAASLATAGLSIGQIIKGSTAEKKAKTGISTAVGELRGIIEEGQANRMAALKVPTKGAELRERQLARSTAGGMEAAQEAGAAGVIGSAGRLQLAGDESAAQIMADLDRSIAERDKLVLGQEQAIEAERYKGLVGLGQMEVQGAQQALADAQALKQSGVQGLTTSLTNIAGIAADAMNPYGTPKGVGTGYDTAGLAAALGIGESDLSGMNFSEIQRKLEKAGINLADYKNN